MGFQGLINNGGLRIISYFYFIKKRDVCFFSLLIILFLFGINNNLKAQIFISPYIGYGLSSLEHTTSTGYNSPLEQLKTSRLYSPSIYLGFNINKSVNEYWGIDFQSDVSYQKFSQQNNSFSGRIGAYFWQFRNSIVPKVLIGEKWRLGIGLNIDYLTSNHRRFDQIKKRLDFGGIFQIDYQLNKHFNVHLNYRRTFKVIDINSNINNPLQSLNLGFGYRFHIKNKKDR